MTKTLTFIIPIIQNDFIKRCVESIHKYTDVPFTIIVIDQTTTKEMYVELKDKVDIWLNCPNLGFASAMNLGIRLSRTPYIICTNDDVEFINKDWWRGILDTFEKHPNCLAVNPMSPKEPGWGFGIEGYVEYFPYKEEYTDEEYQEMLKGDFTQNMNIPEKLRGVRNGVMSGITTWCTVFKKETFEIIGLFDERFYPGGGEDYDMNARAFSKGYTFLGTTYSWVYHHWSSTRDRIMELPMVDKTKMWNNNDKLWQRELNYDSPFDVWGRTTDEKPLRRIKDIQGM